MQANTANSKRILPGKAKALQFKKRAGERKIMGPGQFIPAVNISETPGEYFITIAAPGFRRGDLNIEMARSIMTVSAKKKINPLTCVNDRCEYDYTDWTRAFVLPVDADGLFANAGYHNGELIIHIPRNKEADNNVKAIIHVY